MTDRQTHRQTDTQTDSDFIGPSVGQVSNIDTILENVKRVELNKKIVKAVLNIQTLKMI